MSGGVLLKRADRLIGAQVLGAVLLALAVVLAVDAFGALAREFDEIGHGDYGLVQAMMFVIWTLPRRAYDLFGTASVIGAVLGLGALAATAELTALRAGGMSVVRICVSALLSLMVATLLMMLIGETVGPYGEKRAHAITTRSKSMDLIASGRTGVWAREGDTLFNAKGGRELAVGVELIDVRVFEFTPGGQLAGLVQAKSGALVPGSWTLRDATRMQFGDDAITTTTEAEIKLTSTLDPALLTLSVLRPRNLAMRDLAGTIAYMERNGLDAGDFRSAYWARVFYPLNILAVCLIAMPFAFGALRSGGLGKRLVFGVVLAIAWFFFQRAVTNLAHVYGLDYRLVHLLPATLLIGLAMVYFRRAR
jgi:lipopolysaccharide export system permease protein